MSETVVLPKKRLAMATREMVEAQRSCAGAFKPRPGTDLAQPAKVWHEDDNFGGSATKALTIVLKTRGCDWLLKSGCTMCGYFNDSFFDTVSADQIILQFEAGLRELGDETLVKIYTSGSFFDPLEVPAKAFTHIVKRVGETTGRLSVESQPQILTDAAVAEAMSHVREFEVGIGMESAHDDVLAHSVNKAFRFRQFVQGAELLHRHRARVKTYLVQKAPFLTEREAMEDTLSSILQVAPHSDVVSVNPVNVQKHTLVADLYRHGAYRPPWLWSVSKVVLDASKQLPAGVTLKCHPVGGGHARGAHDCGDCDERHLKALEDYTLGRGTIRLERLFEKPDCACFARWRWELASEGLLGASSWTDPAAW